MNAILPFRGPLAAAALLALLSACESEAPVEADDAARAASGEVLEGSIGDDMMPLESLSSQPPVAAPLPGETPAGAGKEADGAAGVAEAEAGADGEAAGDTAVADAPEGEPAAAQ